MRIEYDNKSYVYGFDEQGVLVPCNILDSDGTRVFTTKGIAIYRVYPIKQHRRCGLVGVIGGAERSERQLQLEKFLNSDGSPYHFMASELEEAWDERTNT